ncbi:hypothetical protein HYV44_02900 [Candidatus Microgenomates bacterium]|nr:hypothetical protein [Candidatus Microgenomates bacterium]
MLQAYRLYAFLRDGDNFPIGTGTLVVEMDDTASSHQAEGRFMLFEKRPIDVFIEAQFVFSQHGDKDHIDMIMRSKPVHEEDILLMVGNSTDMYSFQGKLSMGKLFNTYGAYLVLVPRPTFSVRCV